MKKVEIYGNDDLSYSYFKRKGYILIEDGLINYQKKIKFNKIDIIKKIIKLENPFYQSFGYSKNVKNIYLTGLAPIPNEIKDKVKLINLKELWNKKAKREKNEILNIFGFNDKIIENLKNKNEILYTQPLSEDAVITETEKIDIYAKIIKNYKKETLVIKQHPREKTDYKKIFTNVEVLNQVFPAELFNLLDIKFKKAITLFSTAALSDKNIKVDFYGTEVHPKILNRFGKMDNIMKTNAFIKEEKNE